MVRPEEQIGLTLLGRYRVKRHRGDGCDGCLFVVAPTDQGLLGYEFGGKVDAANVMLEVIPKGRGYDPRQVDDLATIQPHSHLLRCQEIGLIGDGDLTGASYVVWETWDNTLAGVLARRTTMDEPQIPAPWQPRLRRHWLATTRTIVCMATCGPSGFARLMGTGSWHQSSGERRTAVEQTGQSPSRRKTTSTRWVSYSFAACPPSSRRFGKRLLRGLRAKWRSSRPFVTCLVHGSIGSVDVWRRTHVTDARAQSCAHGCRRSASSCHSVGGR